MQFVFKMNPVLVNRSEKCTSSFICVPPSTTSAHLHLAPKTANINAVINAVST